MVFQENAVARRGPFREAQPQALVLRKALHGGRYGRRVVRIELKRGIRAIPARGSMAEQALGTPAASASKIGIESLRREG